MRSDLPKSYAVRALVYVGITGGMWTQERDRPALGPGPALDCINSGLDIVSAVLLNCKTSHPYSVVLGRNESTLEPLVEHRVRCRLHFSVAFPHPEPHGISIWVSHPCQHRLDPSSAAPQKGYPSSCPRVRVAPHIQNGWLLIVILLIEKNIEHSAPFSALLINLSFRAQVSY